MTKKGKKVSYDATNDLNFENRIKAEKIVKDGRIESYKFHITIKDKPALKGEFTREEMDLIYRLYSSEGSSLTQRQVSRYFPLYTIQEFKKILRAFSITKASGPFAPHVLEEKTNEELLELNLQYKEGDFLKKFEQEKNDAYKKKYTELLQKHKDYKDSVEAFKEFLSSVKVADNIVHNKPHYNNNKSLLVYLSDMHIGSDTKESLYDNTYNKDIIFKRMQKIYDSIIYKAINYNITNIVIANLGDSLDGMDHNTTRGGHFLPQNMSNQEQYKVFFEVMMDLFSKLASSGLFNTIKYYAVGTANHDGIAGYLANKALESAIGYINKDITVKVFDDMIGHFEMEGHTFVITHGKDDSQMFKNLPLTLNDRTENFINQYLDYHNLSGNIHFIKGDLHQTATTYGKKFRYKSVSSFFGSSGWIMANFGLSAAGIDMDIIDQDNIFETHLNLQENGNISR